MEEENNLEKTKKLNWRKKKEFLMITTTTQWAYYNI